MSRTITYTCTALAGTNKVGNLQRDARGYYEVVLGGLDAYNSYGAFYSAESARCHFDGNSDFIRRISNGVLRGETGHPRYQEGMSERAWFSRVNDIVESECCVHIAKVQLSNETITDAQGRKMLPIMGRIKPSGRQETFLQNQLDNPEENVCFSIRSFTQDIPVGGRIVKNIKKIVTFDNVNEPGIDRATKYGTPSLEAFKQAEELDHFDFSMNTIERIANDERARGLGMESGQAPASELIFTFEREAKIIVQVPRSYQW